jgi:AcrR family transcriptional regulator
MPPTPRRGRLPRAARPVRRALSLSVIVDAALAIIDAEGLDALTMRRVAEELGTGPASLYAHVANKDEMVAAALDRVTGEIPVPAEIDPSRWQEQFAELFRSAREVFTRHGDIARASLGVVPTGEHTLTLANTMLGLLLAGGVPDRVAALSVDLFALYLGASAFEESMEALGSPGSAAEPDFHAELHGFFSNLPAERFPHLVAMAEPLTTGNRDERFDFGLDLLIRGIESTIVTGKSAHSRNKHQ